MRFVPSLFLVFSFLCLLACQKQPDTSIKPLFALLSEKTSGIDFSNNLTETEYLNIITDEYFYNGGGVAIGDINNDGLADIYFTGNQVANRLYLNLGNLKFKDITQTAGVAGKSKWTNGVTMADVNSDGLLDIYVCNSGKRETDDRRNELFINNGNLTFTEKAKEYGLDDPSCSTQALFVDLDNDNDLDMFLLNRPTRTFKAEEALRLRATKDELGGDKLFIQENGKFIDKSEKAGILQNGLGYGLGVTAADFNLDGWMDIYVSNDYIEPDYLYINQQDGTFSNQIMTATNHISNFGMGVDAADINHDGLTDIFVADMAPADNFRQKTNMKPMNPEQFYQAVYFGFHHQYMYNSLQLNQGDLTFSEIGQLAGVATTDWSWSALFADFDNDTWNDLLITNGFRKDFTNKDFVKHEDKVMGAAMDKKVEDKAKVMRQLLDEMPSTKLPNYIFKNTGDYTFKNMSEAWGFDVPAFSNGASYGDLDNDGDLDIVVNNIDEVAHVFENKSKNNNYLRIKLKGPQGNTSGIGARIEAFTKQGKLVKEHILSRGYLSSVENIAHFGLGNSRIDSLFIYWPDGKMQKIILPKTNQLLELNYQNASLDKRVAPVSKPLFQNITTDLALEIQHVENPYNDFDLEVLLPHKMSQFGPALALADFNQDGLDDFYLGGASGKPGRLLIQNAQGGFEKSDQPVFNRDYVFEDVGAEFLDVDLDGDLDLYVVSGGNEFFPNSEAYQDRLYLNENGVLQKATLPKMHSSGSVVRPFDIDGDGDLDLFVGGRVNPMQYPSPAPSYILINEKGKFADKTHSFNPKFHKLGLITDAAWGDLDGNGKAELVVVGEWTSIMVFELLGNKLEDRTQDYGFDQLTGWWYSLELADINQDRKTDILAGNLGLNYKYKTSPEEPFQVYYNDFDKNGRGDIVLGYYNQGDLFPLRGRQCSSQQMPLIAEKFKTYEEFGKATLEDVYSKAKLEKSIHYQAKTFASLALINQGKRKFQINQLPALAQISSINDFIVRDFNRDGFADILTAGNLYPVEIETPRNDAYYGGLLLGDKTGKFQFINHKASGFKAGGDVKHLAFIRLAGNKEGIIVARNHGKLEIFELTNLIQ
ncbi:MAG: VCBS repeat-containing protein [Microscillaceae bacterium]|nr:VCBS repeat-containing protein [Microscillaceae bacterium]